MSGNPRTDGAAVPEHDDAKRSRLTRLAVTIFGCSVVGALIVVMVVATRVPFGSSGGLESGPELTNHRLDTIALQVRLFWISKGSLPTNVDDLQRNSESHRRVYTDGWGTAIRLTTIDARDGRMEVRSAGPNGDFDDSDDLVREFDARQAAIK